MPIIKTMQGDLLKLFKDGAFKAIAHGCNCRNLMGAGIAGQIREQFPEAYAADTEMRSRFVGNEVDAHDIVKGMGGELSVGHTEYGQVFNLYTQLECGRNADYQLLQLAMQNLNKFCKQRSIRRVGVPLIGAGIGGLDIIAAMTIMNVCTPDVDVTVVVWDGDHKSWHVASQFTNYSAPRDCDGFLLATDDKGGVLLRKKGEDNWTPVNLTSFIASVMQHEGERYVSLSRKDPDIYLVTYSQDSSDEFLSK